MIGTLKQKGPFTVFAPTDAFVTRSAKTLQGSPYWRLVDYFIGQAGNSRQVRWSFVVSGPHCSNGAGSGPPSPKRNVSTATASAMSTVPSSLASTPEQETERENRIRYVVITVGINIAAYEGGRGILQHDAQAGQEGVRRSAQVLALRGIRRNR